MKKFQLTWALIFMLTCMALLVVTALHTFGQQDTTRTQQQPCPCDSLFVRRVNFRIERQLDVNGTVWSALRDQKEVNATLEARIDSLRAIVREWSERQAQTQKSRKR
jgi:hypothetical protein